MELESTLLQAVVIIDRRSIKEEIAFLVYYHGNPVLFGLVVFRCVKIADNIQAVIETRSATTDDNDSQYCLLIVIAFLDKPLYFRGGFFGKRYAH